jgi:hypothetical protein
LIDRPGAVVTDPDPPAAQEDPVTENRTPYPVRVDGSLDPSLSRGLWLVKWLLLIPHFVVLAFLWLAFVVLTVVAFFAILITGRYPRTLFDFNVGVLRWSWRVHHYGYAALGTDRYPPFTLADVPDYPAHLDVAYPERLSRGLVLVKWWLLALPHYLILAVFVGGGIWLGTGGNGSDGAWDDGWGAGGLVAILVLVAGVVLLFTGRYPRPVYDFVLGMDRWALRVAAYVGLMTDRYPPFRLDMGGPDPESLPVGPAPLPPAGVAAAGPAGGTPAGPASPAAPRPGRWTGGRVVAVVIGAVLLFVSAGLLLTGGGLLWADQTQRDGAYLMSRTTEVSSSRYAVTSEDIVLDTGGAEWVLDDVIGRARVEVDPLDRGTAIFVGLARSTDVGAYLGGVGHHRAQDLGPGWDGGHIGPGMMTEVQGGAPAEPPGDVDIWVEQASGTGTQVLDWRPRDGNWTVVVMRADGGAGIDVDMRVGATVLGLGWVAGGLLATGVLFGLVGALLVALAVHRAQQGPPSGDVWTPDIPLPRGPEAAVPGDRMPAPDVRRP